jgi:hypothetical protein
LGRLLILDGIVIAVRYGALRRGASVLPDSLESAMRSEHRRSLGHWLSFYSAALVVLAVLVFRLDTAAGIVCATVTVGVGIAAWLLTRGAPTTPRRPMRLRAAALVVAFFGLAGAALLLSDHSHTATPTPDPLARLAPGGDQFQVAAGCGTSTLTMYPSSLAVTGEAFSCTSPDGQRVAFAYFASHSDAAAWARAEATAQHLPRTDARVGAGWAVVTADQSVLSDFSALGGVAPK